MIRAAQSCPRCLKTHVALNPQPSFRGKRRSVPYGLRYWYFICDNCLVRWSGDREMTELHFDFLVRIGELRPDGTLVSRHEAPREDCSSAA